MNKKQKQDIESVMYFIPENMKHISVSETDKTLFLENSEEGLHQNMVDSVRMDGFNALIQGKIWRGRHMGIYEEGYLDGSMPYSLLLPSLPYSVVQFMRKEMFKGAHSDIIGDVHNSVDKVDIAIKN